jgi:hypothetical protein
VGCLRGGAVDAIGNLENFRGVCFGFTLGGDSGRPSKKSLVLRKDCCHFFTSLQLETKEG